MKRMLSLELVERAVELATDQILTIMCEPIFNWGPRYVSIVVVSPFFENPFHFSIKDPNQTEWDPTWGEPEDFQDIARWKATISLEKGVPSSQLANDFPLSLTRGHLFRYPGGVPGPLNEFAVGTSGIEGRGDEAISRIIIVLMEALAHLEVDEAVTKKRKLL